MAKGAAALKGRNHDNSGEGDSGTRERILNAASNLLASKCMHSFSIRDISAEAGVNSALISYHFGGKEQLYAEVLKNNFEDFTNNVVGRFKVASDMKESIRNVCMAFFEFNKKNPNWLRLYMRELTNHSPYYESIVVPCIADASQKLTEMIQSGVDSGVFSRTVVPRYASLAIAGMMNYFFLIQPVLKSMKCSETEQIDAYADFASNLLVRGMSNP